MSSEQGNEIKTSKQEEEKPFEWECNFTGGYTDEKDIQQHRRWYKCSFCGRPSEVRPHAPFFHEWYEWEFLPIRLCFYCALIQEQIRDLCISVKKNDGN